MRYDDESFTGLDQAPARAFLRAAFAENHDYVWGVHSATAPPPG